MNRVYIVGIKCNKPYCTIFARLPGIRSVSPKWVTYENCDNAQIIVVSPCQMKDELLALVQTRPFKIAKRIARLDLTCKLLGTTLKQELTGHPILPEITLADPCLDEILHVLNTNNAPSIGISYKAIGTSMPKLLNKYVESRLTATLNRTLTPYKYATKIAQRLERLLYDNKYLCSLKDKGQLFIVYCGGIACRLSLLNCYPDKSTEIKKVFGLGGDNDIKIIIDPNIGADQHTIARQLCASIILDELHMRQNEISSYMISFAHNIRSVEIVKGYHINIKIGKRCNTSIVYAIDRPGEVKVNNYGDPHFVYITYNNTLKIPNEGNGGGVCVFDLIRLKCAFEFIKSSAIFPSEFLDISILHDTDTRFREDYPHYSDKSYLKYICL